MEAFLDYFIVYSISYSQSVKPAGFILCVLTPTYVPLHRFQSGISTWRLIRSNSWLPRSSGEIQGSEPPLVSIISLWSLFLFEDWDVLIFPRSIVLDALYTCDTRFWDILFVSSFLVYFMAWLPLLGVSYVFLLSAYTWGDFGMCAIMTLVFGLWHSHELFLQYSYRKL